MNATFELDRAAGALYDARGHRFDAATRTWASVPAVALWLRSSV